MKATLTCICEKFLTYSASSLESPLLTCQSQLLFLIAALKSLKRKKRLEKQLSQLDGSLSTIEFQRETLENAGTTMEVFNSMSYAAKTLKSLHDQV